MVHISPTTALLATVALSPLGGEVAAGGLEEGEAGSTRFNVNFPDERKTTKIENTNRYWIDR